MLHNNSKYTHVFVILRYDPWMDSDSQTSINVVKIVSTEERAQSEVERLNQLESKRKILETSSMPSKYYYSLGRMEPPQKDNA